MEIKDRIYTVIFPIEDKINNKDTTTIEVLAHSEADAINKAKENLSIHQDGKNYQVVSGASAKLKED